MKLTLGERKDILNTMVHLSDLRVRMEMTGHNTLKEHITIKKLDDICEDLHMVLAEAGIIRPNEEYNIGKE